MNEDKKYLLLDTSSTNDLYESYLEWCQDNNKTPQDDESNDYAKYVEMMEELDIEDFDSLIDTISNNIHNEEVTINGTVKFWHSRKSIVPTSLPLKKAMEKVFKGHDYVKVWYNVTQNRIEVSGFHHDGEDFFWIQPTNKKIIFKESWF